MEIMQKEQLSLLIIDDNPEDVATYKRLLLKSVDYSFLILEADSGARGLNLFTENNVDCILLDYRLPDADGLELLEKMAQNKPVIFLTGYGNETVAVEAMKKGAMDYLIKNQIDGERLIRAIRYSVSQKKAEIERENLITQLQDALGKVKTLSGLLPICSSCKKIRDDQGYWKQLESYISEHSDALFSHGYCPECGEKYRKEVENIINKRK
jgi:FixJ family two-component response regulator